MANAQAGAAVAGLGIDAAGCYGGRGPKCPHSLLNDRHRVSKGREVEPFAVGPVSIESRVNLPLERAVTRDGPQQLQTDRRTGLKLPEPFLRIDRCTDLHVRQAVAADDVDAHDAATWDKPGA